MTARQTAPTQLGQKRKQFKSQQQETSKSHIYACFQQPQTIEILKYITMPTPTKLLFDSGTKNSSKNSQQDDKSNSILKRVKQFRFQRIYNREEKFKYAFSEEINQIIAQMFRGFSQTVFIYGTEESKKDKILIGESQNAGFLLTTLAEMFEYCHEKEIEDEVTIKISCSMFKDGKFTDPFSLSQNHGQSKELDDKRDDNIQNDESEYENLMCDDAIQGKYLLGCPQIIIRNMRTALKIINLLTKKIQERRDSKEENTQNIIFTIKLQLDTAYDRHITGEVYEYSIPKLYIVKLANPSIDNTLNGVNKNNKWFINLFNFLQNEVLAEKGGNNNNKKLADTQGSNQLLKAPVKELTEMLLTGNNQASEKTNQQSQSTQPSEQAKDVFTDYIKNIVMKGVADIHCFTSINNKMTSNECLTAFIFNNYLSAYQTKPQKTILNTHTLKNEKNNFEEQLMNIFTVREDENHRQKEISEKYRAKYGFVTGSNRGKNSVNSFRNTSNTVFGKSLAPNQKSKPAKDSLVSPKPQRSTIHHSQSLKKATPMSQTQYLEASTIKQTLRSIISSPNDEQSQTQQSQWELKINLLNYIESVKQFMNCFNLVEYEYAQILSHGCEKLNKYIFNEEIEEFYYAKKISLEHSLDLKLALQALKTQKLKILEIEEKIIKKITLNIKKVNSQLQALKSINGRQQHEEFFKIKKNKLLTIIKQRDLMQNIFEFYNTMSYHYIYEDNQKLVNHLQETKKKLEQEFEKKICNDNVINYDEIMKNIKKGFSKRISERRNLLGGNENDESKVEGDKIDEETQYLEDSSLEENKENDESVVKSKLNDTKMAKTIYGASQSVHQQKKRDPIQQLKQKIAKFKTKKHTDELENMFTNSNVGVVRPQFQRKFYK